MSKLAQYLQQLEEPEKIDVVSRIMKQLESPTVEAADMRQSIEDLGYVLYQDQQELQNLRKQLTEYEKAADEGFSAFQDSILSIIDDQNTAFNAQYFYNKDWFKSLSLSIDAKKQLTQALALKVGSFNETYVPDFWDQIIKQDADTLESIQYTYSGNGE